MFKSVYVEIGNICNLNCSFCPTLKRAPLQMTSKQFEHICRSLIGFTDNLFLHVMGEPLLHKDFDDILGIAALYGYKVNITTNGTLLKNKQSVILSFADNIHKISYSLHSFEANQNGFNIDEYLDSVFAFSKKAAQKGIYNVFRLWNLDTSEKTGANLKNKYIKTKLHTVFNEEWQKRWRGYRVCKNIFLEYDGIFTWPGESKAETTDTGFCHGLIDQIAILADGTVVPCCLDHNGEIDLGNIFQKNLKDILSDSRAAQMRENLFKGKLTEDLCRKCTYAKRFKR
ncbi:MAG: SPASM domain-containing protein [Clostridia bacterium]|nr:SPASM domain-containing protein [Clostridia bacterium]